MARKKKLTISEDHSAFLAGLEVDSMEARTFAAFAELSAKHGAATEQMSDPKFEGKDGHIPDKYREEWDELCHKTDRLGSKMFRAFDAYHRTTKHTIHVPVAEMRQVIYDALMGNLDAMPDFLPLRGPERGHAMRELADNLINVIRDTKAQVCEYESEAPYCDECMAKLA